MCVFDICCLGVLHASEVFVDVCLMFLFSRVLVFVVSNIFLQCFAL